MSELTPQAMSIQSLYGWYQQNKLMVNRRYQRKLVWTLIEKQKLIDSILNGYPIPAFLIAERADVPGTYEIIDGLQRLHAIVSFIEMSFPALDGGYFAIEHFPTAKARADAGHFKPEPVEHLLTQGQVVTVLDYSISMSVMRNATEGEVNDVFGRINTYGHRLSDQERRQAGVQNAFSDLVRQIACSVRGDVSSEILRLDAMPSISIDLPTMHHGYEVRADEVVWVSEGILRSTELRDSMDEQCIADIAACIVGGQLIERSKEALDEIYTSGSAESERIVNALDVYGAEKFSEEFKYCIDILLKTCAGNGKREKLRDIIYTNKSTNPFPSVFAVLVIAIHEIVVRDEKIVSDFAELKKSLTNIESRLDTTRRATSPDERRKNIDTIKGMIAGQFIPGDVKKLIYGNHATIDIDSVIRRSEVELSDYELKQGCLDLSPNRSLDVNVFQKVINTICAIANNGRTRSGKILIGVADKDADAKRIKELDTFEPKRVGKRYVVGIAREAKVLGITVEQYVTKWRDAIKNSSLSSPLKEDVLSHIDYNAYYGLGVLIITIPPQKQTSFVGDEMYWRQSDQTVQITNLKQSAEIGSRF